MPRARRGQDRTPEIRRGTVTLRGRSRATEEAARAEEGWWGGRSHLEEPHWLASEDLEKQSALETLYASEALGVRPSRVAGSERASPASVTQAFFFFVRKPLKQVSVYTTSKLSR